MLNTLASVPLDVPGSLYRGFMAGGSNALAGGGGLSPSGGLSFGGVAAPGTPGSPGAAPFDPLSVSPSTGNVAVAPSTVSTGRAFGGGAGAVVPNSAGNMASTGDAGDPRLDGTFATGATYEIPGIGAYTTAIDYQMGPKRPDRPNQEIIDVLGYTVEQVFGEGARLVITSGKGDHGAHNRHPTGRAADFQIIRPDGSRVSYHDADFMPFAEAAARNGVTGMGAGDEYMGSNTFHFDLVPHDDHTTGQDMAWGSWGNANQNHLAALMAEAAQGVADNRAYGGGAQTPVAAGGGLPGMDAFYGALDAREGGGSYDTLFGYANNPGGWDGAVLDGTQVSQMTMGEALAFADPSGPYGQGVKAEIGRVATPMGRGQIVGTTLRNVMQDLGLPPDTPFSPENQDRVMLYLAQRRIARAGSMAEAREGLRNEWEGFQGLSDGELDAIIAEVSAMPQVTAADFAATSTPAPEAPVASAPASASPAPSPPPPRPEPAQQANALALPPQALDLAAAASPAAPFYQQSQVI